VTTRLLAQWLLMAILLCAATPAAANEPRTLSLGEALVELDKRSLVLAEAKSRIDQAQALIG
jgi:hypothetical protein